MPSERMQRQIDRLLDQAEEAAAAGDWATLRDRARQNAIMTRMESAQNRARLRELYTGPKVDDAFSRFDVLERRAGMAEGHADSLSLGGPPKTLDEEISELRNSEKVDAELEALKASLAKRTNGGEAEKKGA